MSDEKSPWADKAISGNLLRDFLFLFPVVDRNNFYLRRKLLGYCYSLSGYDIVVVEKEYTDHFWKDKTEENKGETYGTKEDNSIDF